MPGLLESMAYMDMNLNEYRCKCGRLLFKGALLACRLEIKCKRCGEIKTIVCGDINPDSYAISAGIGLGVLNDGGNEGVIKKG
jgi:hypothetical protein